ncbi:hypothetical protein LXL04_017491 [Taraxacum kok-saghyz]
MSFSSLLSSRRSPSVTPVIGLFIPVTHNTVESSSSRTILTSSGHPTSTSVTSKVLQTIPTFFPDTRPSPRSRPKSSTPVLGAKHEFITPTKKTSQPFFRLLSPAEPNRIQATRFKGSLLFVTSCNEPNPKPCLTDPFRSIFHAPAGKTLFPITLVQRGISTDQENKATCF